MREKSVVGDLINFRGLVYSPINENGVIFIFGKVIEDLNMYIEEIKPGFPDCIGRRFTGKGWEKVYIEFEFKSSHFKDHGHNVEECNIIVCWENDWPECPIEIIELKDIIKTLPNRHVQRPDIATEEEKYTLESHLERVSPKVRTLFEAFDKRVKSISEEIWSKPTSSGLTYYSPERVFIYMDFQKQGLRIILFTRGKEIEGIERGQWAKGGAKWGRTYVRQDKDLESSLKAIKQSYTAIKEAIKENETTGWFAELESEGDQDKEEANAKA